MKTAIVTGASGGIGRRISETLSADGYNVVMICNNTECTPVNNATVKKCDVTDYDSLKNLFSDIYREYGRIDVLVNNAGIAHTALIQDMSKTEIDRIILTDLNSVVYASSLVSEYMIRQHSGVIVNTSSIWGVAGGSCESVYSARKGGIISFTKALAKELGPSGIRVNCVSPGVIKTRMLDCYTDDDLQSLADETPLSRLGTPDDVAQTVAFLVSEKASFITGQNIVIDGGMIL